MVGLNSLDGKTVSLKSFQGKPVLLDFWATWCGPCVESMPSVKRLYDEAAKYELS
jgi:thiol-disulfide isomerase/thioredoxin